VNDYLARRDSTLESTIIWVSWTVDCIDNHQPNSEGRKSIWCRYHLWYQ
jgi:preprotein translocase subunit SecA